MDSTTDRPVEPYFLDDPPLDAGFRRRIANDAGLPYYVDVERLDDVPADERARRIDLAERVLRAGGNRTGFSHHETIRQSMTEWAPARDEAREDDPGYWRQTVFSLSPRERNVGRLDGEPDERYRKAQTVLAWAKDCIDESVLREIEREQAAAIQDAWREAAEEKARRRRIEAFSSAPPDALDGWTRFDADHDAVDVAYHARNHGTPVVATVYETSDGELVAREFTMESWLDGNGDPLALRPNRFCVCSDADGPYARLRSHLLTFDVESLSANVV